MLLHNIEKIRQQGNSYNQLYVTSTKVTWEVITLMCSGTINKELGLQSGELC